MKRHMPLWFPWGAPKQTSHLAHKVMLQEMQVLPQQAFLEGPSLLLRLCQPVPL